MSCIYYLSLGWKVRLTANEGTLHLNLSLIHISLSILHLYGENNNIMNHLSRLYLLYEIVPLALEIFHSLLSQRHGMVPISSP
jgi:hypothetical protein